MSKFTNRADLLIAAGESIKMQEDAGIEPVCKIFIGTNKTSIQHIDDMYMLSCDLSNYEFPLAVLEGKPVFVGDKLWCEISNHQFTVKGLINGGLAFEYKTIYAGRLCTGIDSCSWNPPKPKTVIVELLREDAETLQNWLLSPPISDKIANACRKALEEQ